MPPVFAHGRLRLYLLKLLDEAPRHGYEIIRLLEERFQGLYAPSAGTVYPRLAKLEAEGLVTHATEGGRKVYSVTDAGRAELADRQGELAELELDIRESVSALASDIREDVRGAADGLRRDMREDARRARAEPPGGDPFQGAKEEFRRAKEQWKEQARRAKEESRRARQDAQQARRQAKQAHEEAYEEVLRIAERVQREVGEHVRQEGWPSGIAEGFGVLTRELGDLGSRLAEGKDAPGHGTREPRGKNGEHGENNGESGENTAGAGRPRPGGHAPDWATAPAAPSEDPARDLDRLLDRFRDGIRDTARDHGVTPAQLAESRRHLAEAAARIDAALRAPRD
ncbi:PadR family transcriptional regulator [Streptomyces albireticuli]|uniref:PadR family transcriptional regulator n=1 Tax=Streptomyces albireticuli TaxID=1940 RepID=A0A2A2D2T6_9ACTN|nr:PadR family transcriptional regulator [Streptomyces albireticuli]MCD9142423.1 helix-turn-helix transcriptional regulator [Streptomyces albireticuli]MCD9163823.1 helix-turn-helix transcriptional regulator [Streptomyces albireticuli]MCD9192551.1 helix-turn-helix transcriptional regulator [Streptomyces albireticuli]PAU45821.1 PadR family transcriptional regulator [Streptomyces albireticuli]